MNQASLTEGSVSAAMLRLAVPTLCANALLSLNGVVNAVWIGKYLGEAALAAVVVANTVVGVLAGVVQGLAAAVAILVGQYLGAGSVPEARRVVGGGASIIILLCLLFAIGVFSLAEEVLMMMGAPLETLPFAVPYLQGMLIALPSTCLFALVLSILRSIGDAKTPLYFLVLSVGLGLVLNPIFIFGVRLIPSLGVVGSAVASGIAQTIGAVGLIIISYRRGTALCIRKHDVPMLWPTADIAKRLLRMGIPMGVPVLLVLLSGGILVALVNRFGVEMTAAFGAVSQTWNYLVMPASSIGIAVTAMVAQCVGARNWPRVHSIAWVGLMYSVTLTCLMVLVLYLAGSSIYQMFLPVHSKVSAVAVQINAAVAWSFAFSAVSIVLLGVARASGSVVVPMLIDVGTVIVLRVGIAFALVDYRQVDAIWWSISMSSAVGAVLATLNYKYDARRFRKSKESMPPGEDRNSIISKTLDIR